MMVVLFLVGLPQLILALIQEEYFLIVLGEIIFIMTLLVVVLVLKELPSIESTTYLMLSSAAMLYLFKTHGGCDLSEPIITETAPGTCVQVKHLLSVRFFGLGDFFGFSQEAMLP